MGRCGRCGGEAPLKDGLCEECRRNRHRALHRKPAAICPACGFAVDTLMHILGHDDGEALTIHAV